MTEDNSSDISESLRRSMASTRKADFKPLGRAEFEARFVEPHRNRSRIFAGMGRWALAGSAFAVVAVGFFLIPKIVQKNNPLEYIATGELKSFSVENYGEVSARNARLSVTSVNSASIRATLVDGECLIRFSKNSRAQRALRVGAIEFNITGTIVFASVASKSVAVIEGQIKDVGGKTIMAGAERNLANGVETPLSRKTIATAMDLADVSVYFPKNSPTTQKEESLEDKLFHKYGNVYSVSLKSNTTIFAAKIKDAESGQEKLFTLKGPLYVSETDIREVKRIR